MRSVERAAPGGIEKAGPPRADEEAIEIVINVDDSDSLFARVIGQIKEAVLRDRLRPGDALPSARQLANDLEVDAVTVARAYRLLEHDAVIQSKPGRGLFVHADAKANSTRIGMKLVPVAQQPHLSRASP